MPIKENLVPLRMVVNGKSVEAKVDPTWTLLYVLARRVETDRGQKRAARKAIAGPAPSSWREIR